MRAKALRYLALLLWALVVSLMSPGDTGASGSPGNDYWEQYRVPWPERQLYGRLGGCPVGGDGSYECRFHNADNPTYHWALDLNNYTDVTSGNPNSDCSDPLRATRSGLTVFYEMGEGGWGSSYLGVIHNNGSGDEDSSWYTHVDYPNDAIHFDSQTQTYEPWDEVYAQGDFAARMGNKGTDACHLHFYFADGDDRGYASFDQWMSGWWPWTGYNLQHLSDDNWTGHASNNTGPGYGRPYSGTCPTEVPGGLCLDRGPENAPLSSAIRRYVRNFAAYGYDVGSTRAAIQGPCGANRRWVKGCLFGWGIYAYSQNFVKNVYGYQIPLSVTEAPDGTARTVNKAMWKAYGRQCDNTWVYLMLGRPISDEEEIGTYYSNQDFERGHLLANRADPQNVYVNVLDSSMNTMCTIGAGGGQGLLDWLDLEHEPCYDVNGDSRVNTPDVLIVAKEGGTSETAPINSQYPGFNYDDRYDVNRDGSINILDILLVAKQSAGSPVCR